MSLNRYEQLLHDYIESRPEEKRYWVGQVIELSKSFGSSENSVLQLNSILWEYFEERARHEPPFKEMVNREGMEKISMLNLSEFLFRMWGPVQTKKRV